MGGGERHDFRKPIICAIKKYLKLISYNVNKIALLLHSFRLDSNYTELNITFYLNVGTYNVNQ